MQFQRREQKCRTVVRRVIAFLLTLAIVLTGGYFDNIEFVRRVEERLGTIKSAEAAVTTELKDSPTEWSKNNYATKSNFEVGNYTLDEYFNQGGYGVAITMSDQNKFLGGLLTKSGIDNIVTVKNNNFSATGPVSSVVRSVSSDYFTLSTKNIGYSAAVGLTCTITDAQFKKMVTDLGLSNSYWYMRAYTHKAENNTYWCDVVLFKGTKKLTTGTVGSAGDLIRVLSEHDGTETVLRAYNAGQSMASGSSADYNPSLAVIDIVVPKSNLVLLPNATETTKLDSYPLCYNGWDEPKSGNSSKWKIAGEPATNYRDFSTTGHVKEWACKANTSTTFTTLEGKTVTNTSNAVVGYFEDHDYTDSYDHRTRTISGNSITSDHRSYCKCGASKIESCTWRTGAASYHYKCKYCNYVAADSTYHSYTVSDYSSTKHKYSCSCGYSYTEDHDSSGSGGSESVHATCSKCGRTMSRTHSFSDWVYYSASKHQRVCSCGYVEYANCSYAYKNKSDSGATMYCTVCGVEDTHTHTPVDGRTFTNNASGSCKAGYTWTCDTCGYSKEYAAISHSWTTKYDNNYHWSECTQCGAIKDKTAHSISYKSKSDSGATEYCTVSGCGYEKAHTHTPTDGRTFTNNASGNCKNSYTWKCDTCGHTKTYSAVSHNWGSWSTGNADKHSRTCQNSGCTAVDYAAHVAKKGNSASVHSVCEICNRVLSGSSGHSIKFKNKSDSGATGYCEGCDYTFSHTHTPTDGRTFTNNASGNCKDDYDWKCTTCGHTKNYPAISHEWGSWGTGNATNHSRTCKNSGCNAVDYAAHNTLLDGGTASVHSKCSVCGRVMEDGSKHSYNVKYVDQTNHNYYCSCGYGYNENHKWQTGNDWTYDSLGTTRWHKCTVDGCTARKDYQYLVSFSSNKDGATVNGSFVAQSNAGVLLSGAGWYDAGTKATLTAIVNTGYKINSWDDAANNQSASREFTVSGPISREVNVGMIVYSISYDVNTKHFDVSEKNSNAKYYCIESNTITLSDVTSPGYDFLGWTGNGTVNPTKELTLDKGSYGDKEYKANWSAHTDTPFSVYVHRQDTNGEYVEESADSELYEAYDGNKAKHGTTDEQINLTSLRSTYSLTGFTYDKVVVKSASHPDCIANNAWITGEGDTEIHYYYRRNQYAFATAVDGDILIADETTDDGDVYYEDNVTLAVKSVEGTTFKKWVSSNQSLVGDLSDSVITIKQPAGNLTMTAVSEDTMYRVAWHVNDDTASNVNNNSKVVNPPDDLGLTSTHTEITMPTLVRKGFVFLGWCETLEEANKGVLAAIDYAPGSVHTGLTNIDGSTVDLYAVWKEKTYKIAYDTNEVGTSKGDSTVPVTGTMSMSNEYKYTDDVTLDPNRFKRTGFDFLGWSKLRAGSSVDYTNKQTTYGLLGDGEDGSTVTLYAAWREWYYGVDFNTNDKDYHASVVKTVDGVNSKVKNKTAHESIGTYYSEGWTLPECAYERPGFDFVGWTLTASDTKKTYSNNLYTADYQPGDNPFSDGELDADDYTFYPVWKEKRYKLKLHSGFDEEDYPSITTDSYYYTDVVAAPDQPDDWYNKKYKFIGWSTEEGSDTVQYDENNDLNQIEAEDGIVDLYAVWDEYTYTVTFSSNDDYCYDEDLVSSVTVEKGYTMKDQSVKSTGSFTMPQCGYRRVGFTCIGWVLNKYRAIVEDLYDDPECFFDYCDRGTAGYYRIGQVVSADELFKNSETVKLCPVWSENQYTVVFNPNDVENAYKPNNETSATGSTESVGPLWYTESFKLNTNGFSREGFDFLGWCIAPRENTVDYRDGMRGLSSMCPDRDGTFTLYAAWNEHSYDINFVPSDETSYAGSEDFRVTDSSAMSSVTGVKFTQTIVPSELYERTGFTLKGFSLEDENSKVYDDTDYCGKWSVDEGIHNATSENGVSVTVYPVWHENQYRVVFHANDVNNAKEPENEPSADGTMGSIDGIWYSQFISLTQNEFSRKGFTYKGWSTTEYENGADYEDEQILVTPAFAANSESSTLNLYAAWKEHKYTISFNPNDKYSYVHDFEDANSIEELGLSDDDLLTAATGSMDSISLYYTESTILNNDYTREGFTLVGWSKDDSDSLKLYEESDSYDANFTTEWSDGDSIHSLVSTDDGAITLYPIWRENSYSIVYNKGTANGEMPIDDGILYTECKRLSPMTFVKTGYTFNGWRDGSANVLDDKQLVYKKSSVDGGTYTLTITWNTIPYKVLFNANGGTGEMGNVETEYDSEFNLLRNQFSREGYHFTGWALSADGSAEYSDEELASNLSDDGSDVTLYAIWEPNHYTIKFDATNGTGSMDDYDAVYDRDEVLPECTLVKEHYEFKGWATEPDSEVAYEDEDTVKNLVSEGSVTLYAIWAPIKYSVVYHCGDREVYEQKLTWDTEDTFNNEFSVTGYSIVGWDLWEDDAVTGFKKGTSAEYTYGELVSNLNDGNRVDLEAVWTPNEYSIRYYANGGTGTMDDQDAVYDEDVTLLPNQFSYVGHKFEGWRLGENGDIDYEDEETVKNLVTEGEAVLYAVWSLKKYSIDGETDPVEPFNEDGSVKEHGDAPTGYSQTGWRIKDDDEDDSNDVIMTSMDDLVGVPDDATLIPYYTPNKYVIVLPDGSEIEVTYDELITVPDYNEKRPGYRFAGWSTKVDGEVEYEPGTEVKNLATDGTVALYPVWEKAKYTLVNEDESEEEITLVNDSGTLILFDGEKIGYHTDGWTVVDTGDLIKEIDDLLDLPEGTSIKPHWVPNEYTVVANGEEIAAVYDEEFEIPEPERRPGNDFVGWSTEEDGDVVVASGEKAKNLVTDGSIELVPIWKPHVYGNGVTIVYTDGSLIMPSQEKDGYHTDGWEVEETGDVIHSISDLVGVPDDATIIPHWIPNEYTLIIGNEEFDAVYDQEIELPSTTDEDKPGYRLVGWSNTRNGEKKYELGERVKNLAVEGNVYLYPVWERNEYYVRGNDGSLHSAFLFDENDELAEWVEERTGYHTEGWLLDGTNRVVDSIDDLAGLPYNTLFTPNWIPNDYTVVAGDEEIPAVYDEEVVLPVPDGKAGYDFVGWKTADDTIIPVGETAKNLATEGSVVLEPVWKPHEYSTGKKDENGDDKTVTLVDEDGNLIQPSEKKEGYHADGWVVEETGKVIKSVEDLAGVPDGSTIVPNWVPNEYEIKLPNGQTIVATYDEGITLPVTETKPGYDLVGWETEDGTFIPVGEEVKNLVTDGSVELTPVWKPHEYSTGEKDENGNDKTVTLIDEDGNLIQPSEKKEGYHADGWIAGDAIVRSVEDLTGVPNDVIVKPNWVPNEYTVVVSGSSIAAVYDEEVVLPEPDGRAGYDFAGWKTEDGTVIPAGETAKNLATEGSVILKPVWRPHEYSTGEKDENGNDKTVTLIDEEGNLVQPSEKKKGYHADGWVVEETGKVIKSVEDLVKIPDGATIVPNWIPNEYTVIVSGSSIAAIYDEEVVLPEPDGRAGYDFAGWMTEDGTLIPAGEAVKNLVTDGSIVLEPVWKPHEYSDGTILVNEDGNLVQPKEKKKGYHADGWVVEETGKVIKSVEDLVGVPSDATIKPNWIPNEYTVVVGDESIKAVYDEEIVLPEPESKVGYKFTGWTTEDGTLIPVGEAVKNLVTEGSVELTPTYERIKYVVKTDNSEEGQPIELFDKDGNLVKPDTVPEGYLFDGWRVKGTNIVIYRIEDLAKVPDGATIVPNWKAKEYLISFDSNGGLGVMMTLNAVYDESCQLPRNTYFRTGYEFVGWSLKKDGAVSWHDGDSVVNLVDGGMITLYASWKEESEESEDGTGSQSSGSNLDFGTNGNGSVAGASVPASGSAVADGTAGDGSEVQTVAGINVGDSVVVDQLKYRIKSNVVGKLQAVVIGTTNSNATVISIPNSVVLKQNNFKVVGIQKKAFKGLSKLKKVSVGNSVTAIGDTSFFKCKSLKKVVLGKKVTKIGKAAFSKCKKLKSIVIKSKKLKKVGKKALKGVSKKITIKVPKKNRKAYIALLIQGGIARKTKVK